MNPILNFLSDKQEEMVNVLKTVVEHESPSRNKPLTDRLALVLKGLFEQYTGGTAEIIENITYGNHVRGEVGSGDKQILMLAHFDTVWPEGETGKRPFTVKDGKAFGPGVFDMKCGLVQGLFSLHALMEHNELPGYKIVYLFTADEEIGSPTSRRLIEAEAQKSEYVFVLEPAMSTEGAIKTSRKGVGIFELKVTGRSAHAGIDPEKGKSAIGELAKHIVDLHNLTDFSVGTTVNVGTVKGGTNSNVIAERAVAEIDLRVVTQAEADRVVPLIQNVKPYSDGVEVVVEGGMNRPPLERTEQVVSLFHKAKHIASHDLGFELTERSTGGGSDGNFTAPFAPTLDGVGAVGDGAHAKHEYVYLSEMPKRSTLLALLLKKLGTEMKG